MRAVLKGVIGGAAAMVLATLLFAPPAAAGAHIGGLWLTVEGKSHVRIESCGNKLCGTIIWLKEPSGKDGKPKIDKENQKEGLRTRPILGLPLLTGFKPDGGKRWTGGRIYNPEDGKTYKSKLTLESDDVLKVEGCVLFFCKKQIWSRVK